VGHGPRTDQDVDWYVCLFRPFEDNETVSAKELTFPGEQPLTIEWDEWKPEIAIQGSMLTLKVVSLSDREFIDYYTTQTGSIYIKVYYRERLKGMNWHLFWRGSLDPEFYEEPYERLDGYDVTLTFSDFGALDRVEFEQFENDSIQHYGGATPINNYIARALALAKIIDYEKYFLSDRDSYAIVCTAAQLTDYNNTTVGLSKLNVQVDGSNFINEEGEAETWKTVIESILSPLGLHIVQRCGMVVIYDLDTYLGQEVDGTEPFIHWTSDSQTLSTAETYSNIKITFSPYAAPELINNQPELEKETFSYIENAIADVSEEARANKYISFALAENEEGTGAAYLGHGSSIQWMQYFHIKPMFGSTSECKGYKYKFGQRPLRANGGREALEDAVKLESVYVPSYIGRTPTCLKLSFDMLYDPRYNPFETADTEDGLTNYKERYEYFQKYCGYVSVPLRIVLRNAEGRAIYYYDNANSYKKDVNGQTVRYFGLTAYRGTTAIRGGIIWGRWLSVPDGMEEIDVEKGSLTRTACYTQFYDDSADNPAMNGWTTNRPTIGIWPCMKDLPAHYAHLPKGMYIPYPPVPGWIEVTILDGIMVHRRNGDEWNKTYQAEQNVYAEDVDNIIKVVEWIAYKDINLSIVSVEDYENIDADDVIVEGVVDTYAKETLDIDALCGSYVNPPNGLRGIYWAPGPICSMKLGSLEDYPERVRIAGLCAQYGNRRTVLSGEASALLQSYPFVQEHNSGNSMFIISASTLDAKEGTEDVTLTEVVAIQNDSQTGSVVAPGESTGAEPVYNPDWHDEDDVYDYHDTEDGDGNTEYTPWDDYGDEDNDPADDVVDPTDEYEDPYWDDRFDDEDEPPEYYDV
jgi:hypothetical protein